MMLRINNGSKSQTIEEAEEEENGEYTWHHVTQD
jgi:hypothetical protein